MAAKSKVPLLDIKLLMKKAVQQQESGQKLMTHLHLNLATKASSYTEQLPTDRSPTEDELTAAFNGHRLHTSSGEAYFWEHCYHLHPPTRPIPVDRAGKAHVFKPVTVEDKSSSETTDSATETTAVTRWECDAELCRLPTDAIDGVTVLLRNVAAKKPSDCRDLYQHLDDCTNPARNNRLGHSLHCCQGNGCRSLLRVARTLSPHFPYLRSFVNRLYGIRRLVASMQAVRAAMNSGDYDLLKASVEHLDDTLRTLSVTSSRSSEGIGCSYAHRVAEDTVMEQFGQALRQVANIRDTYATSACDVCEQLRQDLAPFESYTNKKGYNSDKMTETLDLLYQFKTQEEDFHKFLANIQICNYCADKLCGNKEVARSFYNQLSVVPTPDCITQLNLFEKALIKFCMTCITVVRLGQVTNTCRPRNELTAALKGRIAYLPVNLQSNATFLPDQLLNVQNLVILVGSQPTQQQRVWTSVVDLRNVHAALSWLRDNNPLYKDVPVYTLADIKDIIDKQLKGEAEQHSTDDALLKRLSEASKSYLYENFSVQPLSGDFPADAMVDYQLDKVNGQSSDLFDAELDLKAFPELFPTGEHGLKDSNRTVKIGTSDYIKSRLLNKHSKFRLNINYLFHSFQLQEVSNMCHSIGHMLRTVTGNNLTAKAFMERLEKRDGEVQSKMFSMMANLRGSQEYFAKLGMDLKWMIKRLGPPTLFITCSTAEWFFQPLIQHLKEANKDVPNINNMTPAELCCMDPVNVSIHFHQKWNAIFTKLFKNKKTPVFGEVEDHFWRIEYQSRGAPHVHCVLWIKDAPILGQSSLQEVQKYISTIATCSMPDADTSPTLYELVKQFQVHKCNKYCTKSYKRNGTFYKKCRFGFPRPEKAELEVNDVIDCLAVSKNKQPRKRLYHLPRNNTEQYINDYNPALLLVNQANVDIQYIGHLGSRLPYYITDYITKQERSEQDTMWQDIFTTTKSLGSNAMSFLLKSIKSRQVGANEAADRLLGHKLYSKSRQLRFADLAPQDKAKRILKPAKKMKTILEDHPDSSDIFQPHWVLDVYPDRPDELESCSLYSFLGWYEKERTEGTGRMQLKSLGLYVRRRKDRPYIVTHQTVNPHQSDEMKELYYYYLLKLFKPWRAETDLCLSGITYAETYFKEANSLPDMKNYHENNVRTSSQEEQIEKDVNDRAQAMRDAQEDGVEPDQEGAFEGCRTDQLRTAMQEVIDAHTRSVQSGPSNQDDLHEAYRSLNADQKRIADKVVNAVCHQHSALRLIISGQGGTGKSRVISYLNQKISHELSQVSMPVVVAAPTGLAAFSIGGTTIHRLLSLPVEHGKPADYSRLQQEQLTLLKATLRNIKLLILDEVSMVSSLTLLFIHMRLTEILSCNDLFGGINVVFFADFLQLPPVKGNQPFIPVTFLEAKQRFGAIASVDVWKAFEYDELTINMRQNGDQKYADLLSNLRIGKLTDEHYSLLRERLITAGGRATVQHICHTYNHLTRDGQSPLILMPRTNLCEEINLAMLKQIGTAIHSLTAIDTLDTIVDRRQMKKVQQAYDKSEEDMTRTAGLEKHLQLCVGCRVMLKRNRNVEAGLVNGSVGTVTGFNTTTTGQTTTVNSVSVKFEKIDAEINIERDSSSFEVLRSVFYTRKQFPLMLAFAITIHKSQGLSLQTAIVDAGATNFGPGMLYVALSRVTSLAGLHLIDIDKSKVACDRLALKEYNRLRHLYTPELGDLATVPDSSSPASSSKHSGKRKESPTQSEAGKQKRPRKTTNQSADAQPEVIGMSHTFKHCDIESVDESFQAALCARLNLTIDPDTQPAMSSSHTAVARKLEHLIQTTTNTRVNVVIHAISSDGNCLFRALGHAVTRSQRQHDILRLYITDFMAQPGVVEKLQSQFAGGDRPAQSHTQHIVTMQQPGEWGTEQEIVAAAHLFDCSIVCFSQYSHGQFCLQHFPPHFLQSTQCTDTCHHHTIYLINSSGAHYESAVVRTTELSDQSEE